MKIITLLLLVSITCLNINSKNYKKALNPYNKVIIIGLDKNVSSNYFPNITIAEELKTSIDSIDIVFNRIISNNIMLNRNAYCKFQYVNNSTKLKEILKVATIKGENENRHIDLSSIDKEKMKNFLSENKCDFILILNQHYLKWQDVPFRTLFSFVNYSLFDKEANEILQNKEYYTTMNLVDVNKMKKSSKRMIRKVVSSVERSIIQEKNIE